MASLLKTHDDGAPSDVRLLVPQGAGTDQEHSGEEDPMFFDIDLTIRAAVARERELQRTLAAEQAQGEQR